MINNIYETHLEVSDLNRSIEFYSSLGLELGAKFDHVAFFWVGQRGEQMLGLWLVKDRPIANRHFAFGVDLVFLLKSKEWLAKRAIEVTPDFNRGTDEPLVHTWMPAAAYYFKDPDQNSLEFISMLPDQPKSLGFVPYLSEWQILKGSTD
jgi:lactoylglutathione lyase